MMPGDVFKSHAELAEQHSWTGDDCRGMLRIVQRDEAWAFVECDVCGLDAGVPVGDLDASIRAAYLMGRAGFPARFAGKLFAWSAETARVVDALGVWAAGEKLTPTPVLWGRPGRGKTHLAVMVAQGLIARRQVRVLFRTAPSWLSELQAAIGNPGSGYDETWRRAADVELLVLDDLGAEQDTDWRADRIAALIDERYRADRPVLATTNIAPANWADAFDARTASRLHEMSVPYELVGVDRRQQPADLNQPLEDR